MKNQLSRRELIAVAGGTAAMFCAAPVRSAARQRRPLRLRPLRLRPLRLRPGDTIGLIGPSSAVGAATLERCRRNIASLGFGVKEGRHLLDSHGYLAGKDRDRARDINAMFADRQVRAIMAMRGGWGSARLLRYIDWGIVRANPKLLIGYSDVTALHLAIAAQAGFATIHGPNAANTWSDVPAGSLKSLASGEASVLGGGGHTVIAPGLAQGKLLGGNLSVLSALVGTRWMPDMTGAILFLEDVNEAEYRIDRMMTQLREAGILAKLSGFVFGTCRACSHRDPDYKGFPLISVLQQHIAPLGIPAFSGANFGHVAGQFCLPMGVRAEIDAAAGTIRPMERAVR